MSFLPVQLVILWLTLDVKTTTYMYSTIFKLKSTQILTQKSLMKWHRVTQKNGKKIIKNKIEVKNEVAWAFLRNGQNWRDSQAKSKMSCDGHTDESVIQQTECNKN